jgi:hypothetical protein
MNWVITSVFRIYSCHNFTINLCYIWNIYKRLYTVCDGQSKSSWKYLTSAIWCTMSFYCLGRVLVIISMCKFCRGSAMHISCCVAIPCRGKHSCHHPTTVLSGSHLKWPLAVPYSENGPQGDTFHNHRGHQIECDNWTLEDSERSLLPVLPIMTGLMEQLFLSKGFTLKVIRWVLPYALPWQCITTIPGMFWVPIV